MQTFIIRNTADRALLWSNADGWGDCASFFSDEERERVTLPIGGEWGVVPSPEPAAIAKVYSRILFEELGLRKFRIVRKRNRTRRHPLICHSHDFCDANMVMEAAMIEHGVVTFGDDGHMPDSTVALWGEAWGLAARRHLTAKEES